uniref:Elongation factor for RNA polymerase II 3 n=1 Tax=Pelodiscus sinensis TaxID=13735 RepID=K7FJS0_PELSI
IKIPGSPGTGARLFTFYLSRYSKDKPQASFDCVRQYVSSSGSKQRDCVGSIQEKITVCATDGSCQLTQERVSQAEAAWSRAASEIKPEAPGHGEARSRRFRVRLMRGADLEEWGHPESRAAPPSLQRPSEIKPEAPGHGEARSRRFRVRLMRGADLEEWGHPESRAAPPSLQRPQGSQRLAVLGAADARGLKQPCPLEPELLSSEEEPRTYRAICSVEQQQAYAEAFSADYAEYRRLHARVGHVSRTFVHLGAKIKGLPPGSPERKVVEERILQEYQRLKQTYPSYRKEKDRCEYLHQKLSHIKGLILDFEKTARHSWV